ncbi:diguanylate cyclase/phosphodiesterase with PAS/PAC sensor(s) [Dietzia cinnamea P4]|nr:diguanylate cyclase/phosphodiesterase with PAS/PAC sensor(s) [Dietzia cinnamea P4]
MVRLDDDGVVVPPSEFVRVAERAGMATRLDHWVVRAAVAMAARLRRIKPDFSMWINVSAQSVSSEQLGTALLASLADYGVPPSAVVLELTETSPVNDVSAARSLAQRLRTTGVRLALDDFGTGFASLIYLRHLLFDFVKIDGEFVAELDTSETDCAIVRSIVDLAAELGMQAVAEHVGSPGCSTWSAGKESLSLRDSGSTDHALRTSSSPAT